LPSNAAKKFLARHKADASYRPFTAADRKRLGNRLPEVVRAILEKDGWSSYDKQVLWLCDPDDWQEACAPWLPEGAKSCDMLVRSSFGDMVAWDGETFWLILPHSSARIRQTADPDWLFNATFQQEAFHFNDEIRAETAAAAKKCGKLEWDQMYNYAPALALGGSKEESEIAKEDARVALSILHQIAPIASVDT
jgi:hypothetical protein